jgi:sugar/nucleoside kinase (ribokinase family)
MSKFDVIAVGDASMDVFISPTESETLCQLDDKDELICFTYGDKIPVDGLQFSVGGNAANNSVGVRRLGLNSAVVLTLGNDDVGEQIKGKLLKEGVDTSLITTQEGLVSNYSAAITVYGERTIFTYKSPATYQLPEEFPEVEYIYLTSMGDNFEEVYGRVVDVAKKRSDLKLVFNPGSRQLRAGLEKIRNVLEISYILYVNRKEAELISGFGDSKGKETDLLKSLTDFGVKIPVVTDGSGGSYLYDGEKYLKAGILPVDSYERTGAGDAFGSGFLSALVKGRKPEEALIWGTVNSASVIGYAGAQKGLLTENQMPTWLERAESSGIRAENLKS